MGGEEESTYFSQFVHAVSNSSLAVFFLDLSVAAMNIATPLDPSFSATGIAIDPDRDPFPYNFS